MTSCSSKPCLNLWFCSSFANSPFMASLLSCRDAILNSFPTNNANEVNRDKTSILLGEILLLTQVVFKGCPYSFAVMILYNLLPCYNYKLFVHLVDLWSYENKSSWAMLFKGRLVSQVNYKFMKLSLFCGLYFGAKWTSAPSMGINFYKIRVVHSRYLN